MAVKHPVWTIVSTWKKMENYKTSTVVSHKHDFLMVVIATEQYVAFSLVDYPQYV